LSSKSFGLEGAQGPEAGKLMLGCVDTALSRQEDGRCDVARANEVSYAVGPVNGHGEVIEDLIRLENYKDGATPPLSITTFPFSPSSAASASVFSSFSLPLLSCQVCRAAYD
jgi:hypothetical protein